MPAGCDCRLYAMRDLLRTSEERTSKRASLQGEENGVRFFFLRGASPHGATGYALEFRQIHTAGCGGVIGSLRRFFPEAQKHGYFSWQRRHFGLNHESMKTIRTRFLRKGREMKTWGMILAISATGMAGCTPSYRVPVTRLPIQQARDPGRLRVRRRGSQRGQPDPRRQIYPRSMSCFRLRVQSRRDSRPRPITC